MNKNLNRIISLPYILISLFIGILSIIAIFSGDEEYLSTIGTISDIKERYDTSTDEISFVVFVDYEIDGESYHDIEYNSYDSSMKVGKRVEVLYSPYDHTKIQAPGTNKVPYITLTFSGLVFIFGIYQFVKG